MPAKNLTRCGGRAGVDDGSRLRVRGEGNAGRRGGEPGDLYVFIGVRPHPKGLRREGTTVHSDIDISYVDAILGTTVQARARPPRPPRLPAPLSSPSRCPRLRPQGCRPSLACRRRPARRDVHARPAMCTPGRRGAPWAQARAAAGAQVTTVDGLVDLKIPAGTQPGTTLVMAKRGVPRLGSSSIRGDHQVGRRLPRRPCAAARQRARALALGTRLVARPHVPLRQAEEKQGRSAALTRRRGRCMCG